MRYLITFSYDGSKFHGFQRQNKEKNVQGTLEKALSKVLAEEIVIKGSGRTDAGVHAYNQCAHFDTGCNVSKTQINAVNDLLKKEVFIKKCEKVNENFHARYSVKKKVYVYKMNVGDPDKKLNGYYFQQKCRLDIKKMREAAKIFEGTHDFQNFVSGKRDDYVSTIYKIRIYKLKSKIFFVFEGVGFYRYMVRHIVGALLSIGKGKIDKDIIIQMLEKTQDNKQLVVAPADGLYLKKVIY